MSNVEAAGRSRPDACPGLVQTHPAADGPLARVRTPGGAVSPAQLRALATAARDLGTDVIELTSRANAQVRGVRDPAALTALMTSAGLLPSPAHERVRNIVASPLGGRTTGALETDPLVRALDAALCARPDLAALPGRFLFALDDGSNDVTPLDADVTLTPDGLLLAGHPTPLTGPPIPLLLAVAETFLALRENAWRLTELSNAPTRITTALTPNTEPPTNDTPDTPSPTSQDRPAPGAPPREADDSAPGATSRVKQDRHVPGTPAPTSQSRPAPSTPPREGDPSAPGAASRAGQNRPAPGVLAARGDGVVGGRVGVFVQRDGRFGVQAVPPLGRMSAAQAEVLAGCGEVLRFTPWRSVMVLDLPAAEDVVRVLREAGFAVDDGSPWLGVTACTGSPGCAKSLADVQRDARRWTSGLERAPEVPVHWAGCERGCGTPRGRVVQRVATVDGYRERLL